jgi:DNA-binding NarL/FixJ family response regulator
MVSSVLVAQATQVLKALVQGVDPLTGEELIGNAVLQRAEVLRALLEGISALQSNSARQARRASLPANVGAPWSTEDEQKLIACYQKGESVALIAKTLGRTLRAIESRLERLGLLTGDQRVTDPSFESKRG